MSFQKKAVKPQHKADSRGFLWHILHLGRKPVTAAGQYRNRECGNKPRMGVIKPQIATMQRRNRRRQT